MFNNSKSFLKLIILALSINLILNQESDIEKKNEQNKSNYPQNLKFLESKEIYDLYIEFISIQGKSYDSIDEFNKRFEAFKENIKKVGKKEAVQLPKFIDISQEDFRKKFLKFKVNIKSNETKSEKPRNLQQRRLSELPKSFDWRTSGKVSSVKEQGECGCCWAFSAAANLESMYAIKYGKILDLSEEQLLDCDRINDGCDGGNMEDAFKYIRNAGGLMNEVDYRYTQKKDTCKFIKSKSIVKVSSWKVLDTTDEDEMAEILMKVGPLSVGINADNLQLHENGIFDQSQSSCPKSNLNHAVMIVGFGEENGKKFWIVKNSWGENWAENGFFRIARGKSTCGINQYVVYGKLE